MSAAQFHALLPLLLVSATLVALLTAISIRRHHSATALTAMAGLNLALGSVLYGMYVLDPAGVEFTSLITVDSAALLAMAFVLVAALGVLTLCHAYFEGFASNREEIYLLIGLGTLGGVLLSCASHVASLLIGIELMGLPMVAGVAYATRDKRALEGGMKYLILSAAASATMLFGFALIYALKGSLDLASLSTLFSSANAADPALLMAVALVLVGFAFKLSVVPFHQWTPDVYESAPAPVAAFLATVSKIGVFVVLLRLFQGNPAGASPVITDALTVLAIASMLIGSVLALRQASLKRLMAYSSIAHFGYILVVLVVPGPGSLQAAGIYLAVYTVSSLAVFGVMALMSSPMGARDVEYVHEYRGLFWRRPYLASILIGMMFSLAGVPVTAGFIGKFAVVAVAVEQHAWWLVGSIVLGSAISVYYYLRVIITLFHPAAQRSGGVSETMGWAQSYGGGMLVVATMLALVMGVLPNSLYLLANQFLSMAAGQP